MVVVVTFPHWFTFRPNWLSQRRRCHHIRHKHGLLTAGNLHRPALVIRGGRGEAVTLPLSHLWDSWCTAEHRRECRCSLKMETTSFHMPGMCSSSWNPIKVCTSKSACGSRGMPDTFSNDEKISLPQKHFNMFLQHRLWIIIIYFTCKCMKVYHR